VPQDSQEGFGHAVYCAREWVGDEPFLLALRDTICASDAEASCTRQLMDAQARHGVSAVGVKVINESELGRFGCVTGTWEEEQVLEISEFAEKPSADYARDRLQVAGLPDHSYLGLFGQYILSPKVFEILGDSIGGNRREAGEFQLTSCLDRLRLEEGFVAYRVQGRSYDIGVPAGYRQALIELGGAG
jgi:UTP--glucose-1-phosphate uridylyltransferase